MKPAKIMTALLAFSLSASVFAGERADAKRECKEEFNLCLETHSRAVCKDMKRQCRIEHKVTFKDDMKYYLGEVKKLISKTAGAVDLIMGVDETNGEYIRVAVEAKYLKNVGDLHYVLPELVSYVDIAAGSDPEKKEISITLFTKDMERMDWGAPLQTSEGRAFPKFINGVRFDHLFGTRFDVAGVENFQYYLDPEQKVTGIFIPTKVTGSVIYALNKFKNEKLGQFGKIFPNINSIPITVKYHESKIGRISLLSLDDKGENSGIVVLFDIEAMKAAAQ